MLLAPLQRYCTAVIYSFGIWREVFSEFFAKGGPGDVLRCAFPYSTEQWLCSCGRRQPLLRLHVRPFAGGIRSPAASCGRRPECNHCLFVRHPPAALHGTPPAAGG